MGQWMARAGRELLIDADALPVVPLHWQRLWVAVQSGFSTRQGGGIRQRSPVFAAVLRPMRATSRQVGLSRSARVMNVQGAFAVIQGGKAAIQVSGSFSFTTCSRRAQRLMRA